MEERRKGWRGMAGAEKPNARRSVSTRATVREGGICREKADTGWKGGLPSALSLLPRSGAAVASIRPPPPTLPKWSTLRLLLLLLLFFFLLSAFRLRVASLSIPYPSIGSSFPFLISPNFLQHPRYAFDLLLRFRRLRDPRAADLEPTISFRLVSGIIRRIIDRVARSILPPLAFLDFCSWCFSWPRATFSRAKGEGDLENRAEKEKREFGRVAPTFSPRKGARGRVVSSSFTVALEDR